MVRGLVDEKLDGWLAEASEAAVMNKIAAGLRRTSRRCRAGLTENWSTGPIEGFIHKLKPLKCQGYGRVTFDLLRARALAV